MSEKKRVERLYNLVEERRPVKKMKNPLEEVLEEEDYELAREARRLRLQELIERRKREIEKLRKEYEDTSSKDTSSILGDVTPELARQLAELPEEKRAQVIQTYAMLKGAEKSGAMALMLPLLIGYARTNPNATQNQMVEFAKVMADQIKTGIELARQNQPQQPQASYNPIELIKVFGEMIRENVQKPLEEVVKRVQPRPSALEQILMDDKLFERAKALGLFGGGGGGQQSPEIQLQIEKLRQERDLKLKEMEMQHQRWMMEQQIEAKKWDQIGQLLNGPLGPTIQMLGKAAAAKLQGPQGQQLSIQRVMCPRCGAQFPVLSDQNKAVCPKCGAILERAPEGGQPSAGEKAQKSGKQQ